MYFKTTPPSISLFAPTGFPMIEKKDDLSNLVLTCLDRNEISIETNDIIAIAQKIVSKAEGRLMKLSDVKPTQKAVRLARQANKDPRLVELILQESNEILRVSDGVIIVEHRLGHVLANAGIDRSNIKSTHQEEMVLLLPINPDQSAEKIRNEIKKKIGINVGVIITDSIGRAWRLGTIGHAIGSAGIKTIMDLRYKATDLFDRELQVTCIAWADQLAAAASLAMGETNEGTPVVIIKGIETPSEEYSAQNLIRSKEEDLFR
jgi:coenzyme F420-0:L-glutamate ligase/coenzyme F420-1:gamma-L-glutamate ligase|tara:strand:+ start:693 stop:1478 length:786 start_codon:yes stop_codon:yes gene_type:complete